MVDFLNQGLWIISSLMIFLCGIYFSFKLNFIHLNFKAMLHAIFQKQDKKDSISSFQALAMSLAGRIGVGSLSGIALAVYLGGPRYAVLDLGYFVFLCYKRFCRNGSCCLL